MKCDRCGRKIESNERPVHMGNTNENMATICEDCRKIWNEIYSKRIEPIKNNGERSKVWLEEYFTFLGIITKEMVQFT